MTTPKSVKLRDVEKLMCTAFLTTAKGSRLDYDTIIVSLLPRAAAIGLDVADNVLDVRLRAQLVAGRKYHAADGPEKARWREICGEACPPELREVAP